MIGNTMEQKDAVKLQSCEVAATGQSYVLDVAPYSAGVLTVERR